MDFKYDITLIIPVYNVEKYINACFQSVLSQTVDKNRLQVILVDDGSTDSSADICKDFAQKYSFAQFYQIENNGPANARNFALDKAEGKYIAYLDSDDRLSENTLEKIIEFFDEHYEEIDEVTYKIVPVEKGVRKKVHFRYDFLKETGVYDLNDEENIYISQTTMNIAVKNLGKDNIKFDLIHQHEDQKYNIDILKSKMKIGFVADCEYLYERNPNSIVKSFNSTIFDETMSTWEAVFDSFAPDVPKYIQALYCNDILWKTADDILFPYHLSGEEFINGVKRITALLQYIDDGVLLNHPNPDEMNKFYFLDLKYKGKISVSSDSGLVMSADGKTLFRAEELPIYIDKVNFHSDKIELCGTLISPLYKYCEKPELYINVNSEYIKLDLYDSSHAYNRSKFPNSVAYGFRFVFKPEDSTKLFFKLSVNDAGIGSDLRFGQWVPFNSELKRTAYVLNGYRFFTDFKKITVKKVNGFNALSYLINRLAYYLKKNRKTFAARLLCLFMPSKRIWLYHDCKGYSTDNGYYQFIHDFYKNDGAKRYYVVNGNPEDYRSLFDEKQFKNVIVLRSMKHKLLYLKAEKIITAYIEKVNYIPFFDDVLPDYIDLIHSETVYLQHGVLHAHLPWKYSYDRLNISKEVISTQFEYDNFTKNYCFPRSALIKSKMPRYDCFDDGAPAQNKILFAPSWRRYLISFTPDGSPVEKKDKFLNSDYFKKTYAFLHSDRLKKILEENDYILDFKLHPIFSCYKQYFELDNGRIRLAPSDAKQSEYKIFITDYSSFVFDFVYLNRAIIYYMPDYTEFKAGMNDYRELDIPFENGFGEFCENDADLIDSINKIIGNGSLPLEKYYQRNAEFFFNHDKNCCDEIYKAITSKDYE